MHVRREIEGVETLEPAVIGIAAFLRWPGSYLNVGVLGREDER